jgi:hypothetical protein
MAMPMVAVIRETEVALLFVFSRSLQSLSFRHSPDEVVAAAEG